MLPAMFSWVEMLLVLKSSKEYGGYNRLSEKSCWLDSSQSRTWLCCWLDSLYSRPWLYCWLDSSQSRPWLCCWLDSLWSRPCCCLDSLQSRPWLRFWLDSSQSKPWPMNCWPLPMARPLPTTLPQPGSSCRKRNMMRPRRAWMQLCRWTIRLAASVKTEMGSYQAQDDAWQLCVGQSSCVLIWACTQWDAWLFFGTIHLSMYLFPPPFCLALCDCCH